MIQFDTDGLPPHERFDHWCEVRAKNLFGVTIELDRERRPAFRGRFSAVALGRATFAEMAASSYRVSRTSADIARVSGDSLCIGQQIRGPGWLDIGRNGVHFIHEGALTLSHSDQPMAGTPQRSDGFLFRTLKIPLAAFDSPVKGLRDLSGAPLSASGRFTKLALAAFNALARHPPQVADADIEVRHVAQLALLARGQASPRMPESRAALRSGYRHAARDLIARNLHRADLSPAMLAAWLGISLRQLHLMFEPTGTSVARTITAQRLAEARRLLTASADRQVSEIALACGFDSIATFYRVFRQAYGLTPTDMRIADGAR
ncbi:MAG: AraC family transcriptional regulator [Pseudomonadota bacterium]